MKPYQDKQLLTELYKTHKSQQKIAEVLGCNHKTIAVWMKKFEIKTVGTQGARRRNLNHDFFEFINTEDKAYWLGFLYADGCVYKGSGSYSYRLQINLQARDQIILDRFQEAIDSNYKIQEKTVNNARCVLLKVNSTKMCEDLMRQGVIPRKSLICVFPKLETDLVHHFIRGYFDGDGCLSKTQGKRTWSFSLVGNQSFLDSVKEIFHQNNIKSAVYDINHSKAKSLEAGSRMAIEELYKYLYEDANIYLERKRDKFLTFMSEQVKCPLIE